MLSTLIITTVQRRRKKFQCDQFFNPLQTCPGTSYLNFNGAYTFEMYQNPTTTGLKHVPLQEEK